MPFSLETVRKKEAHAAFIYAEMATCMNCAATSAITTPKLIRNICATLASSDQPMKLMMSEKYAIFISFMACLLCSMASEALMEGSCAMK